MSSPEHINDSQGEEPASPSAYDGNLSDLQLKLDETPKPFVDTDADLPMSPISPNEEEAVSGRNTPQEGTPSDGGVNGPEEERPEEEEAQPAEEEEVEDTPTVLFESAEDALQALIAIATRPIDEPHAMMGDPIYQLLTKLGVKERTRKVGEYRAPPQEPHPSSTLLMLKRRLHDEFRMEKSEKHRAHCDALQEVEDAHKARMQELLDKHEAALLAVTNKEAEMMPLPAAPTAKSIHALQKQLGGDATHQMDAATRRLSTLWKTKYERNCAELIQANEVLMVSRSEYEQLNTLDGRDAGFLETKLSILRDDLEAERAKGDSLKQAFLLECRNNGVSPEGFKEAKHKHLGRRQLQDKYGVGGEEGAGGDEEGADIPQPPVMINGEFLLDEEQLDGGRTFSFTPDGCRLPSIREIGQRIAELEREVAIQTGISDKLLVNIQELEKHLDEAQMTYSRRAGAIASNEQLPYIETLLVNKSNLESNRSARFEAHFTAMRHIISNVETELSHAKDLGTTIVSLVELEAEAKKEMRLLDIAHARETMIQRISKNVGELSKVDYFNARLHTLACEKRLLDHEFEDAKEKADKAAKSLEERFATLGMATPKK